MKTLIFDFDGTIADSFELALDIAYDLMGMERLSQAEINRLRGLPAAKIIRELHIPITKLPRIVIKGRQKMHERMHEVQPFEGMPEVLAALHTDKDLRLWVMSSNSEPNVRSFLRTYQLEQYFDEVYGNVGVFNKAPALRKVMRKNRLAAQDCLYIGDEVRDIAAARKAGLLPVSVSWGFQTAKALADHKPFALARKPADLLHILQDSKV
jgi:phosphoglycolate phosphatase